MFVLFHPEVSLHSWLVWPMVGHAAKYVYYVCTYNLVQVKWKCKKKSKGQRKLKILWQHFFCRDLKASWGQSLRSVSTCRARHQYLKNPEKEKKILKNYTHSLPRQKAKQSNQNSKKEKKSRNNFKNQEFCEKTQHYLYLSQLK